MFYTWALPLLVFAYLALLFSVAHRGDRGLEGTRGQRLQPWIYSLSLAVYCTSWTFYGAVGSAATGGFSFLPIYLGPILVFTFGYGLLRRMVRISKDRNLTSIADFLANRYGRSRAIAVVVTLLAIAGGVPYIALQLKAVVMSLEVLGALPSSSDGGAALAALVVGGILALFAILFGARELDATEHHRGMMWAIALESVVKLVAFVAIGVFALGSIGGWGALDETIAASEQLSAQFAPDHLPVDFLVSTLLAMAAVLCLPRQFHVAVVEYRNRRDLARARWVFPVYLAIFSLWVIPVAVTGLTMLPYDVVPDTFVLAIPLAAGRTELAVLAFLGGFSAATGMVIVATVALATMVSNDLVLPLLMRGRSRERTNMAATLLRARQAVILAIVFAAWGYFLLIGDTPALASIGLLAFAAVAQFAPALVLGTYWPGATRAAAIAGLSAGGLLWAYTLLLPTLAGPDSGFVLAGPLGIEALRPQALLGLEGFTPLAHGVLWSLGANVLIVSLWSLARRAAPDERMEAVTFIRGAQPLRESQRVPAVATLSELEELAGRFVGRSQAEQAFAQHAREYGWAEGPETPADASMLHFTERLLSGSIGTASARSVLTGALQRSGMRSRDADRLLTATSQVVRFNRQLLESTLDSISQGVSVVDEDLCLVGWNQAYLDLFDYPEGLVHLGRPIGDLIRHNGERGMLGAGNRTEKVERRLELMRRGQAYRTERRWPDGRHIELRGQPMPGGGYVTTFNDVTEYRRAEKALAEANETLEERVASRTRELRQVVEALEGAKSDAEAANRGKSRFLAAASHDLLQPLNAARLFASVLAQHQAEMAPRHAELVERVDASLTAAEELLGALLDISKLDRGVLRAAIESFPIADLMGRLERQFAPLVHESGLSFRLRAPDVRVQSDPQLLRRIVQNFVANAFRYTPEGGILLGCRRRGGKLRIAVYDTGPGISIEERDRIFNEFHREAREHVRGQQGLGLGLAISRRMAVTLGHELGLESRPGHGSCFWVEVPIAEAAETETLISEPAPTFSGAALSGLAILCVDNDADIREGMLALLERWGCEARAVADRQEWLAALDEGFEPDVLLLDYLLDNGEDGLTLLDELGSRSPRATAILVTAERSDEVQNRASERGVRILRKPLRPARLRSLLTRLTRDS